MEKSPSEVKKVTFLDQKLEFTESTQSDDFKKNVCYPYFKDIYKVLWMFFLSSLGLMQQIRRQTKGY